jgi:hypothetical protein
MIDNFQILEYIETLKCFLIDSVDNIKKALKAKFLPFYKLAFYVENLTN